MSTYNYMIKAGSKISQGLSEMGIKPDQVVIGLAAEAGAQLEDIFTQANWLAVGDFKDEHTYRTCKLGDIRYRWPKA